MKWPLLTLGLAGMLACTRTHPPGDSSAGPELPAPDPGLERIYGVTVDSVDDLEAITESLRRLNHRPTTRVVFDEYVPASEYLESLESIHRVSWIMGELLDSSNVSLYSPAQYRARVTEYLDALSPHVDIWEIGNEVNGEWLGEPEAVVAKIEDAFHQAKQRQRLTALTLYYNEGCAPADNEMFTWVEKYLPASMRDELDYVLVSYYEDDCDGRQPDWQGVFHHLATLFPKARLGMGECGTTDSRKKAEYIRRYYGMKLDEPRFVGGFFWWYFKQDMVPYTRPLWQVLNETLSAQ
ncbi:hypothetical protein [Hyalangium versicolor]|uniref:hypothetical protein n=1 Tax=Hyalangium versicolor TaxID=2861190 RepID=UPI001CCC8253|nr:hypothetical protein [Hyalangium versicolor]